MSNQNLAAICFTLMSFPVAGMTADSRSTDFNIHGTRITVIEPAQLSREVKIVLKGVMSISDDKELVRRMQTAVQALRGCRFNETTLRKSGRSFEVSFSSDCWFYQRALEH